MREQRRAALLQARQQRTMQRAQLRAQLRAVRRTSTLGPLLLVGLGLTFLLLETGKLSPQDAASWFARWWPLILVSGGFVLLLEWALDSFVAARNGSSAPARHVGAGTSFLLTLVMLAGIALTIVGNRSDWIPKRWNTDVADSLGLDQVFAQHREIEQDLSAPLTAGAPLTIQNYRGNISVTGSSEDGQVHVIAHQHFSAWRSDELRARENHDRPVLDQVGQELLLRVDGEGRDRTDLTIEMPHQSAVQIVGERGDVTLSELRGSVTVTDHKGNIALSAITGDVHLKSLDDSAAITGHSLTGPVSLEGRSGDIALSDVTGPISLQGDFFGTTHLERVKGAVHFHTSYTEFACAGVPGEMNVEGRSELEANNIDGPLILTTSDRNLTLTNVRNGATVQNRNGSVSLALAAPLGAVRVTNSDGAIDVQIPEKVGFALSAETADGEISNDLGLKSTQQDGRAVLNGQIRNGGPALSLATKNGDIKIHRTADAAQSDDEDKDSD